MPGDHGLDATQSLDNSVLFTLSCWGVLSCKQPFTLVMAEIEDDGTGQKWKQSILLELEAHDWSV